MTQPEGCQVPSQENKVCKLLKFLYDFKTSINGMKSLMRLYLLNDGFSSSDADRCTKIL